MASRHDGRNAIPIRARSARYAKPGTDIANAAAAALSLPLDCAFLCKLFAEPGIRLHDARH
eukprot:820424-Rhodomonas_salina.1